MNNSEFDSNELTENYPIQLSSVNHYSIFQLIVLAWLYATLWST